MRSITAAIFVPQWSRAHLHQLGVDLDDPFPMKVGVFSSSLTYLQVLFSFLKRYPNTINALLSILGISYER